MVRPELLPGRPDAVIAFIESWWACCTAIRRAGVRVSPRGYMVVMQDIVDWLGPALEPWGYVLLGVVVLLEGAAFFGLIVPGEAALLLAGFLVQQGKLNLAVVLVVAFVGTFIFEDALETYYRTRAMAGSILIPTLRVWLVLGVPMFVALRGEHSDGPCPVDDGLGRAGIV